MKVSKEAAEEYLKAFKSLDDACKNISDKWYFEIDEFGDIKVGDIYYVDRRRDYPEDPKKCYYIVDSINGSRPGNLTEIRQIEIIFYPLCRGESSFITSFVHQLEESNFKKIRYLKGRCNLFKGDECLYMGETYKVSGFLIEDPLVLITNKKKRTLLVYPHEIESV